jgi:hypothetical protein
MKWRDKIDIRRSTFHGDDCRLLYFKSQNTWINYKWTKKSTNDRNYRKMQKKCDMLTRCSQKDFKISTKIEKKFGKTSKLLGGFCFLISIGVFNMIYIREAHHVYAHFFALLFCIYKHTVSKPVTLQARLGIYYSCISLKVLLTGNTSIRICRSAWELHTISWKCAHA